MNINRYKEENTLKLITLKNVYWVIAKKTGRTENLKDFSTLFIFDLDYSTKKHYLISEGIINIIELGKFFLISK